MSVLGSVTAALSYDVTAPTEIVLRVAVPHAAGERLSVTAGGRPLEVTELPDDGGRQHVVHAPTGPLTVTYTAEVTAGDGPAPVTDVDRIRALRPSRYCPSDRIAGFALGELGGVGGDVTAIAAWVHQRLQYVSGVSGPTTDAIDTLLAGQGVCRDYAHLTTALCRAAGVPARVAAVYAPGLSPMDFHLVTEAAVDGAWHVVDATRLAPRPTLMRIATGRDAADVAFSTSITGALTMTGMEISAVAAGDLPVDDHSTLSTLR